jgi:beta-galactosidase beta subunit
LDLEVHQRHMDTQVVLHGVIQIQLTKKYFNEIKLRNNGL